MSDEQTPERKPGAGCPEDVVLAAYVGNRLGDGERIHLASHLSACERCRAIVAAPASVPEAPPPEAPPDRIWPRWAPAAGALATVAAALLAFRLVPGTNEQAPPKTSAVERPAPEAPPPLEPAAAPVEADTAPLAANAEPLEAAATSRAVEGEKDEESAVTARADAKRAGAKRAAAKPPAREHRATREEKSVAGVRQARSQRVIAPAQAPAEEIPIILWRTTPAGVVERSEDGGESWAAQAIGADVKIVALMPVTANAVWVVGERGTVLRTLDGTTWTRLPAPTDEDLVMVVAPSLDAATVKTASGRSFETTEAGATWHAR